MATDSTTEIYVHQNSDHSLAADLVTELEPWLRDLVRQVAPETSGLGVKLIDDSEMIDLNDAFRDRQETTDVLSFPAAEGDFVGQANGYLGDVAISVPVASRQAVERDLTLETELKNLMIHGVLHCLGYDHETDNGEMQTLERELRSRFVGSE